MKDVGLESLMKSNGLNSDFSLSGEVFQKHLSTFSHLMKKWLSFLAVTLNKMPVTAGLCTEYSCLRMCQSHLDSAEAIK